MSKVFYCCLPVLLFSLQLRLKQGKSAAPPQTPSNSGINVMDSNDIRIFLESRKTTLYTISNTTFDSAHQDKGKHYINGYQILLSTKLGYKKTLSLKMQLLNNDNYKFETSRCSFFAKYCLQFSSRYGSLMLFLPDTASCNEITILKINTISNKETEFSFTKAILDKIKTGYKEQQ